MDKIGNGVLRAIEDIKAQGVDVRVDTAKQGDIYSFGDSRYRVKITINPPKWLGLEFDLLGSKLWYPLNTDLYDTSKPENHEFVEGIELAIVDFLHALKEGGIKKAEGRFGPMLLIPEKGKHVLLKQGRFLSSKTTLTSPEEVSVRDNFHSFPIKVART